jgi:hypothetical protein
MLTFQRNLKTSATKKRKFGKISEMMEGFCFAVSVKKGPNEPNTAKDDDDDGLM